MRGFMSENFYITTTLPYVNASPHIGFALEIIEADVIARYHREILHHQVIFNTGTDEHGQKIATQAQAVQLSPQEYCDRWVKKFQNLQSELNLSNTHFIRTTNAKHQAAAQEFWRRCQANGDIYKANYAVKYCVGCELAKTASELVNNHCPLHPNQELELREEENYFFRFSRYQKDLLKLYESQTNFVKPVSRFNEIKAFVSTGLEDFSISRLKKHMPWGVAVPDDDEHVMYVWFDALVNYISTLGWPENTTDFQNFWPAVQVAGKDNLRQQAAMWQAMLMSAGLTNSKQILINGFIGVDGQKMSKSLGNVIKPKEMVKRYGIDASRYLLIKLGAFGEDIDVSWQKFDTSYNAYLANGLGNLCSRLAKMANLQKISIDYRARASTEFQKHLNDYDLTQALNFLDESLSQLDQYLALEKPWLKENNNQQEVLTKAIHALLDINQALQIFMPKTASLIEKKFNQKNINPFTEGLFKRIE
jgi:methionyl-tRNA synthetase